MPVSDYTRDLLSSTSVIGLCSWLPSMHIQSAHHLHLHTINLRSTQPHDILLLVRSCSTKFETFSVPSLSLPTHSTLHFIRILLSIQLTVIYFWDSCYTPT